MRGAGVLRENRRQKRCSFFSRRDKRLLADNGEEIATRGAKWLSWYKASAVILETTTLASHEQRVPCPPTHVFIEAPFNLQDARRNGIPGSSALVNSGVPARRFRVVDDLDQIDVKNKVFTSEWVIGIKFHGSTRNLRHPHRNCLSR